MEPVFSHGSTGEVEPWTITFFRAGSITTVISAPGSMPDLLMNG